MRLINIIIKNCSECPYQEYDPDYSMNYDSGYDCNLVGKRIADDGYCKRNKTSLKLMPIPDWCELVKIDEVIYNRKKNLDKILKIIKTNNGIH